MRTMRILRRFINLLFVAVVLSLHLTSVAHGALPLIDPPRLPAAGRQTATVTIFEPGRYAITAASSSATDAWTCSSTGEPTGW